MKNPVLIILTTVLLSTCNSTYAQVPAVKKIENVSLIKIMNNLSEFKSFKTKWFYIRLYIVGNQSGSAKLPESDEISSNIYIAVSEFDEAPRQNLFLISDIINPTDFVLEQDESCKISYVYTTRNPGFPKKKMRLGIGLNKITIQ